jgi:hypothetical protein
MGAVISFPKAISTLVLINMPGDTSFRSVCWQRIFSVIVIPIIVFSGF